jgi:SPP1 gp7 family putative phage head morphogenesis protein
MLIQTHFPIVIALRWMKKNLGAYTRQKISREMVNALTSKGLSQPDPKRILEILYYRNLHAVHGKYDLLRMQKAGLTMYIWSSANDERTCSPCKIMEGLLCKWSDPTVYSKNGGKTWVSRPKGAILLHPGENICEGEGYCWCTALSYYKELISSI